MKKNLMTLIRHLFHAGSEPEEPAADTQAQDDIPEECATSDSELALQTTDTPTHNGMTDQILEALKELGFQPEPAGEIGYTFRYEGMGYLYMPTEDEEQLKFSVPQIYEADENTKAMMYYVTNTINCRIRYANACIFDDTVWLFYEHALLDGQNDLKAILTHIIQTLDGAQLYAKRTYNQYAEEMARDGDEATDDNGETATDNGQTDSTTEE